MNRTKTRGNGWKPSAIANFGPRIIEKVDKKRENDVILLYNRKIKEKLRNTNRIHLNI